MARRRLARLRTEVRPLADGAARPARHHLPNEAGPRSASNRSMPKGAAEGWPARDRPVPTFSPSRWFAPQPLKPRIEKPLSKLAEKDGPTQVPGTLAAARAHS